MNDGSLVSVIPGAISSLGVPYSEMSSLSPFQVIPDESLMVTTGGDLQEGRSL